MLSVQHKSMPKSWTLIFGSYSFFSKLPLIPFEESAMCFPLADRISRTTTSTFFILQISLLKKWSVVLICWAICSHGRDKHSFGAGIYVQVHLIWKSLSTIAFPYVFHEVWGGQGYLGMEEQRWVSRKRMALHPLAKVKYREGEKRKKDQKQF